MKVDQQMPRKEIARTLSITPAAVSTALRDPAHSAFVPIPRRLVAGESAWDPHIEETNRL